MAVYVGLGLLNLSLFEVFTTSPNIKNSIMCALKTQYIIKDRLTDHAFEDLHPKLHSLEMEI